MQHKRRLLALATLAWITASGGSLAHDPDLESTRQLSLEDLLTVDIATGAPRSLADAPAVATVITAADIERMGAGELDEVLESVPELHVGRTHGFWDPVYVMRGVYSETGPYVLFLVNGVPLSEYFSGNTGDLWGGMPVHDISRIEVIRGPGSALYGAEAVVGVVNVITKTAAESEGTRVAARAGSFDTRSVSLLHGSLHGAWEIVAAVRLLTTDGHRDTVPADAQTGLDALVGTDVSQAPGPLATQRKAVDARLDLRRGPWRARVGYRGRFEAGTGAGVRQALDRQGEAEAERLDFDAGWSAPAPPPGWKWGAEIAFRQSRIELTRVRVFPSGAFIPPAGPFPDGVRADPELVERTWLASATARHSGFSKHVLTFGLGARVQELHRIRDRRNFDQDTQPLPGGYQDVTDDPSLVFGLPQGRTELFALFQDEWQVAPSWELTWGARFDRYDDFGGSLNPRAALVWRPIPIVAAKLLYGRSFRAPAYREQHLINNNELRGNPDLDPEVADTFELALEAQALPRLYVGADVFGIEIDELIRPVGSSPSVYRNVGNLSSRGAGVHLRWVASDRLQAEGSYSRQVAEDDATDADPGNAPRDLLFVRAGWSFRPGWHMDGALRWVGDRRRKAGDVRPAPDDDWFVDLTLDCRPKRGQWSVTLRIDDLLDEGGFEPSLFQPGPARGFIPGDLPLPGRRISVELGYRFGQGLP